MEVWKEVLSGKYFTIYVYNINILQTKHLDISKGIITSVRIDVTERMHQPVSS